MDLKLKVIQDLWLMVLFICGVSAQIVSQEGDKCSRDYVCPPQYLRLNTNCYYFSKNKTTWQEAFFTCNELHGKFVIIRNAHQDQMLQSFLNKVALVNEERWIGGMYDWEQMTWKWSASGKEIQYKGFADVIPDDKESLQWHCIVLDPAKDYKWSTRSCVEQKHFICQTKLRKVTKKDKKKLQRQYNVDKYNKLNEVPVPEIPDYDKEIANLKDHKPRSTASYIDDNSIDNAAFANRTNTTEVTSRRDKKRKNRKNRRRCETVIISNGTEYNSPQLKYGKRRRRNKSKENKEDPNSSVESMHTKIYYSGIPKSPLHPRVITEELTFP